MILIVSNKEMILVSRSVEYLVICLLCQTKAELDRNECHSAGCYPRRDAVVATRLQTKAGTFQTTSQNTANCTAQHLTVAPAKVDATQQAPIRREAVGVDL